MLVLLTLIVIAIVVWAVSRAVRATPPSAPPTLRTRHFDVDVHDGGFVEFVVRPADTSLPSLVLAMIPGAAAAAVVLVLWLHVFNDFVSPGVFFSVWAVGTVLCWPWFRRRARVRAFGTRFTIGPGCVVLARGEFIPVLGQYVLTRRNTAGYNAPAAFAHRLDLGVDGVTYVLADGMSDQQSMALYHEVGRRMRGDP